MNLFKYMSSLNEAGKEYFYSFDNWYLLIPVKSTVSRPGMLAKHSGSSYEIDFIEVGSFM